MTNTTTINAVAEAKTIIEWYSSPSAYETIHYREYVCRTLRRLIAAIEAYETAQRSDKEACHSKSVDSESQTVREMTVHEIQTILAKDMSKEAPEMEDYWHDVVEDGVRELAKLGTIRITGGME